MTDAQNTKLQENQSTGGWLALLGFICLAYYFLKVALNTGILINLALDNETMRFNYFSLGMIADYAVILVGIYITLLFFRRSRQYTSMVWLFIAVLIINVIISFNLLKSALDITDVKTDGVLVNYLAERVKGILLPVLYALYCLFSVKVKSVFIK